jgi:hypothetical protein
MYRISKRLHAPNPRTGIVGGEKRLRVGWLAPPLHQRHFLFVGIYLK